MELLERLSLVPGCVDVAGGYEEDTPYSTSTMLHYWDLIFKLITKNEKLKGDDDR